MESVGAIQERGRSCSGRGGGGGGTSERDRGGSEKKDEEEEEDTGDRDGGEVGIADGDGDGRVNVLPLALGHGELRPTTQGSSSLLCTERAGERNARARGQREEGPRRRKHRRGAEDSRWNADG